MRGILKPSVIQTNAKIFGFLCRNVNTSHARLAVDKGLLSKLRKQTGIPFINCKKALEKFDNDFDQAKQWLQEQAQKEGWARATKLQSRPMSQGLVALIGDRTQATMLEVNCETDFVARNDKFVEMVTKLVQECKDGLVTQDKNRMNLSKDDLGKIGTSDNMTLADIIALNVGNMGENMALRRAAFLRASDDSLLCSYIHPSSSSNKNESLRLGKYGAVVELCRVDPSSAGTDAELHMLGSHLCQHIVGMNPKAIGEFSPQEPVDKEPTSNAEGSASGGGEQEEGVEATQSEQEKQTDDLLSQEFLLDASLTVGELLHSNGVVVKDFVRYGCGEEVEGEKEE